MTWFDLAIVLNAFSLVAALFATGGLMVLATMLIQDPRGSDRSFIARYSQFRFMAVLAANRSPIFYQFRNGNNFPNLLYYSHCLPAQRHRSRCQTLNLDVILKGETDQGK